MKNLTILLTLIALLITANQVFAQPQPPDTLWTRTYGGSDDDEGYSVQQTSDGGYIIAGSTWSYGAGSRDVYLIKTDANGNEIWSQTYGGSDWDEGWSVQQTSDGGYIIAGLTESYGAGSVDVYLIKTDANGNEQWSQTYGGSDYDKGKSVQQTSDGGYIIAGWTYSYGAGNADVYLIKTDANGNEQWYQTLGGSDYDLGYSVQQTSHGGYIIAGWTESYGAGAYDVYLIKTDANGNEIWYETFGGSYCDEGNSVQQTTDGGYIIAGSIGSYSNFDVYLIKTDENGNEQWTQTFGGSNIDVGYSVQQTSGGYIIAGRTHSYGAIYGDVYLIKTDASGNEQWTQTFGGSGGDCGYSVQQASDGGYIIAGETSFGGAGGSDVYLLRVETEDQFSFTCEEPSLPGLVGSETIFYSQLTNLTTGEITVHLNFDTTGYPSDWGYQWIVGQVVIPSFIFEWETVLQGGAVDTVTVYLIPNSLLDEGSVAIIAYSLYNPSVIQELTFSVYLYYITPTEIDFQEVEICYPDSDWVYIVNGSGFEVPVDTVYNSLSVFSFDPSVICSIVPANDSLGFWVSFAPEEAVYYTDTLNVESGGTVLTVALSGTGLVVTPAPVTGLTIEIIGPDAVLTWNPVDTTIHGNPITVDTYIIFYSEIPYAPDSLYFYLWNTPDTTFTHLDAAFFADLMFYEIVAYVGEIEALDALLAKGEEVSREEVYDLLK